MRLHSPDTAGPAAGGRVWFAQALRAVACLLVVAAHHGILFPTAPDVVARHALFPPLTGVPRPAYLAASDFLDSCHLSLGLLGNSLFFLVSGFVIPFSLRGGTLRGFFVRRFCRLYPTLWVVQLVVLGVLAFQARHYGLAFPFGRPRVLVSNALLVNAYLGHPYIEAVCWTLLIEEIFYALCAVCAWRRVLGRPAALVALAVGLTAVSVACSAVRPSPAMRQWQVALHWLGLNASLVVFILVGVVLHQLYVGAWRLRLGLPLGAGLVGLYAAACFLGTVTRTGGSATFFVSALAALAVFVPLLLADRRLPYWRWLDRLADISYPLYLIHATLGYVVIRAVYLGTGSLYLGFAAALGGAAALAALLHRLVERPGLSLGRRLAPRPAPAGADPARQLPRAA